MGGRAWRTSGREKTGERAMDDEDVEADADVDADAGFAAECRFWVDIFGCGRDGAVTGVFREKEGGRSGVAVEVGSAWRM